MHSLQPGAALSHPMIKGVIFPFGQLNKTYNINKENESTFLEFSSWWYIKNVYI